MAVNHQVGISKFPVAATHKNSFQVVNKILLIFNQNYVRTLNKLGLLKKPKALSVLVASAHPASKEGGEEVATLRHNSDL